MPKKISSFLSLLITLFLVLTFGILGSLTYYGFSQKEESRFQAEVNLLSSIAKKAFINPLWTYDTKLAESMLLAFMDNNSIIKKIRLTYDNGSLMAESQSSEKLRVENLLEKKVPVLFDGVHIGDVTLYFSREKILAASEDLKNSIFLIFTLVTLNLITVVTLTLNHILGRPMKGLVDFAQAFQEGRYELQRPNWLFEFREIGVSFWQALQDIQARDRKISEHQQNLEKAIAERTSELDQQRLQMVQQNRLATLGEFSAGVAHEINNPLAVIGGKSMIIKRKIESYPELNSVQADVEKISSMVNRISRIIVGLRNFARDSSTEEKSHFPASKFVDDIQDLTQIRMTNRGIIFKYSIEPKDLKIYGREVQLSQVVINLLNNSIDAVEDLAEKWIEIKVWSEGRMVLIQLCDSGPGIPPEIQEKIFQPFFTTKETGRGTGIGLSISMGIINAHGGELIYNSKAKNTTFLIRLPKN